VSDQPAPGDEPAPGGKPPDGGARDPAKEPSRGRIASARAGVTKMQARAQDMYQRLEASRPSNQVVDAGFEIYERDLGAGGGVLAGALAFRLFIFAVPYVWVLITIFGSVAGLQHTSGQDAARSAGLTGLIAKSIADAQRQTGSTQVLTILVGVFALFWASRHVVKTLRAVHALAWRVPLRRLQRPTAAAGLFIAIITLVAAFTSLIGGVRHDRPFIGFVLGMSGIVVWGGGWLVVSWLLPRDPKTTWMDLAPGALLFGLVVWVLHLLTVFYFSRKISSASETYGAIGSAIGILLALYLVGRAMSASAVLNATLWDRKKKRVES
jgi:uncharacterized BrkB/YihY/UPF0761 family membrane protein